MLISLLCLAAAGVGVYLFMFDVYTPRENGSNQPAIATLLTASGQVQRKPAQSYLWSPAGAGTKFYLNDAVQTGPDAKATLRLTDGGRDRDLEIGPDAMVIVGPKLFGEEAPKKTADVKRAPPVKISSTPTPAPVMPQPPPSRAAVREPAPVKGRAARNAKTMPAIESQAQYSPPAATAAPEPPRLSGTPLSLESPSYDEKIEWAADEPPVKFLFSWEKDSHVTGRALSYRFEVTKYGDYSFAEKIKSLSLRENAISSARVGLRPGAYYWRVRIVDAQGETLRTSPVSKFSLRPYTRRTVASEAPVPAGNARSLSAPTRIKVHVE